MSGCGPYVIDVCVYVCVCERLCVHACLTGMSTFVCACVLYNV